MHLRRAERRVATLMEVSMIYLLYKSHTGELKKGSREDFFLRERALLHRVGHAKIHVFQADARAGGPAGNDESF
jgi:hypothetical protein